MTFVHIGIFITAVSFALVSIFLAKILLRVSGVIQSVGQTVSGVESKLDKTIEALENSLVETNATALDVEVKLQALDSVFHTIKHVGDTSSLLSEELETTTEKYNKDASLPRIRPFVRIIQLTEFTLGLLRPWKRGKRAL
ncbi:DUF948 domain-containing protein [Filibacter tadaridae]|uniref:DUF948 domain-containing protein n=1 Tax=Filibacter tadaridae TaxID=2483811 RepID=A0A3P5X3J2_9BACL|nr:DUF948 domain-containing protein [Filibacter tadaridae]VDC29057.1 hypothetical protein FILTAD_01968 [Filibacter tadaridae]